MNNLAPETISEVIVRALERTAFVLADTVYAEDVSDDFQPQWYSRIGFTGIAEGTILLSANEEFVRELAASMLGVEPDEVELASQGRDALNELANIIGGSIIIELGGRDHEYQYGLPSAIDASELPARSAGAVDGWVESEDGVLCVSWLPQAASKAA